MVLFDNHNHSQFSFDGKRTSVEESSRAAVAAGLGGICFSDHNDFYVPESTMDKSKLCGVLTDVPAQQQEIDRVQSLLPGLKILKGIEIGMHQKSHEVIRQSLEEHSFDQVIASVHYVDETDPFFGDYYEGKDWKEAYGHYLETIYREMTWLKDFDIMGHFDYIVRYASYEKDSILYRDFSDILDAMFKYLIQEGKALEINTKSYQDFHGRKPVLDPDILLRYREMGGEIISFGSDSHEASKVGLDFRRFAEMIRSYGFRWTAHYENRKLIQLPL